MAIVRALLAALLIVLVAGSAAAAATPASVKFQLRGHLPELGESPSLRIFDTNATYDAFRTSLGDANVFPPASSLFMSFDTDRLALYGRGNDSGGRCLARTAVAQDGTALTLALLWENGTCGAPLSAHYPFLLVSLSRASADGGTWVPAGGGRSVCATVGPGTDACTTIGAVASPSPTAASASPARTGTASPTTASPSATTSPSSLPTATAAPTAPSTTRPPATSAAASVVVAASPTPARQPADSGPNYILIAIAGGVLLLILIAVLRSRSET